MRPAVPELPRDDRKKKLAEIYTLRGQINEASGMRAEEERAAKEKEPGAGSQEHPKKPRALPEAAPSACRPAPAPRRRSVLP